MRFAILSDIHANLEALETADAYLRRHSLDEIFVLGDTVGYGANPVECLEWTFGRAKVALMGNHEKGVTDASLLDWFNPLAREAIVWTAKILPEKLKQKIRELQYVRLERQFSLTHSSLHEPEQFHYLLSFQDSIPTFKVMKTRICFVGHTHIPSCFMETPGVGMYTREGEIKIEGEKRYVLNPGSVGQPRDQDKRLSFGIYDDEKGVFEIVRLEYDAPKAARKILAAKLPEYLATRLL
ncbi:MAG: metallophosphoesterase family protein [Candidatus Omnitrophica bacterium]|nr:metallophosphoesterase family protein [Candidatus Omnitrophota bacterium]